MRYLIIALTILLPACGTMEMQDMFTTKPLHQTTTRITPNGDNTFVFVARNKPPAKYSDMKLADVHSDWLAKDLAYYNWCKNGYEILAKEPDSNNEHTVYSGKCN